MFQSQNRIIIVDDQDSGLLTLAKKFSDKGLTYKLIHYSQLEDIDRKRLTGIRLAFFDINLATGQTVDLNQQEFNYETDASLATVYNTLSGAIESIISPDNGPFVLVFWSSNTPLINNFIKYVNDRQLNLPKPLSIKCIDKNEVDNIAVRINEIIGEIPIRLLYSFERKCEIASSHSINEIFSIIPKQEDISWGENDEIFENNFKQIFSHLAISSLGANANDNVDKGIIESLTPIVNFQIEKLNDNSWKEYLGDINRTKLDDSITSRLNRILHINLTPQHKERGAVYAINLQDYSLIENYNVWVRSLISFKNQFKANIQEHMQAEIQDLIDKSIPVAVEISAACDYSQNNARSLKYILGVKLPLIKSDLVNTQKPFNTFDPKMSFCIEDDHFQIFLDFNYIISSSLQNGNISDSLLFSFKKEIIDMIGNRYANHISRIGITSF